MNILLQILDEGRITDAHGRTVNFENTVIVMTSNAGSNSREALVGFNRTSADISREKAMRALSDFLRPEFLSRIDEIVVFRPLNEEDYKKIAVLMLNEYVGTLNERGITLRWTDEAVANIAHRAVGGKSGARDIHPPHRGRQNRVPHCRERRRQRHRYSRHRKGRRDRRGVNLTL